MIFTTAWFADDMRRLQTHRDRIVGIMLSKTESKADLDKTVAASTGNLPIIALIEFARGILGWVKFAAIRL